MQEFKEPVHGHNGPTVHTEPDKIHARFTEHHGFWMLVEPNKGTTRDMMLSRQPWNVGLGSDEDVFYNVTQWAKSRHTEKQFWVRGTGLSPICICSILFKKKF